MNQVNINVIKPHILPVLIILLVNIIYFFPQFEGKEVQQGDIIQYQGMAHEVLEYERATGEDALWTNSMFGGMPTYQIVTKNKGNVLGYVDRILNLGLKRPAGMFIAGMLAFYVFLQLMGVNIWLSLIGALFFGLSTNNLILYEAGHVTKLRTIMYGAPALGGIILAFRGKYLYGTAMFALFFGLNVFSNHPQMTYYLGFVVLILGLVYLTSAIKNGTLLNFAKASGSLIFALVLALGASASQIWTTFEYSESTMRGKPILASEGNIPKSSSETDGLEWEYAMSWSNSYRDLLSSFIPKAVGGGSGEWVDGDAPLVRKLGMRKETQLPTYWGGLPFTSGPIYFGAVAFFLFVFGAFAVKGELKWWLVSAVIFTMLLSLGKNLPELNRFLYENVPLFNKFRTPNSVLSVTAILIPLLGVLGLREVVRTEDRKTMLKPLYISYGILGGLALFVYMFGSDMFAFTTEKDENYKEILNDLILQRQEMLSSSAMNTFLLISLVAAAIYFYLQNKISQLWMLGVIGVLGFGDLYAQGKSYLDKKDFVSSRQYQQNFEARDVDLQIMEDKDPNFRVFDASINTFNAASSSYFHKTIGGYHAAKLQRFQDVIDRHISNNNMEVLNMLNTKYFILGGESNNPRVQRNPAALGNAWFVNDIIWVENANAEIDSLGNFDPAGEVVIHKEFESYAREMKLQKNGSITLKTYSPNKLVYTYETQGEQFAVFSEIWYGPNKGWEATVDGKPADHIRVNYLLRGMRLPEGKHEVVFEFKPVSYYTGAKIAYVSSFLILLLAGYALYAWKKNKGEEVAGG